MQAHHTLMDGRLHVYKRENSRYWQCSTYLDDHNWRVSTRSDNLKLALDYAEDWYIELRGKRTLGVLKTGKSFKQAAEKFIPEYKLLTEGERNPDYVEGMRLRIEVHLMPFFGEKTLNEITTGLVQDYRVHRQTSRRNKYSGETMRPSRSSLKQEIVALHHVLKYAQRQGWLNVIPDLSEPYGSSRKIVHRAWFSPEEYRRLYEATRERAKNPPKPRWKANCENFHDYVLFMANTGLRPDEAGRLEFRDVKLVYDKATRQRILEIDVRGKRGVGFCKSTPMAVRPYERVLERKRGLPTDRVFGKTPRILMHTVLTELGMKFDREGNRRDCYSLRHSYICFRLMEGADVYVVAKNCRTSVEMIEKHYAQHIKHLLDASAINVRRTKRKR